MKLHFVILSAFLISACSMVTLNNVTNDEKILGSWSCSQEVYFHERGGYLKFKTVDVYTRDGFSNDAGIIKLKLYPDSPVMEYSIVRKGIWRISNNDLTSQVIERKVVSVSHPEFDKKFNLQEKLNNNEELTSTMATLNRLQLNLVDEEGNEFYKCTRHLND